MATKKVNKNIDFLVDEHGNLVGSRNPKSQTSTDPTYGDAMLVTAKENLVTGGIELSAGGPVLQIKNKMEELNPRPLGWNYYSLVYEILVNSSSGMANRGSLLDWIKSTGGNIVRFALPCFSSAQYLSLVHSTATMPLSVSDSNLRVTYITAIDSAMDALAARGLKAHVSDCWNQEFLPDALGETYVQAYGSLNSKTTAYAKSAAVWFFTRYKNHPAFGVYGIGNEYTTDVTGATRPTDAQMGAWFTEVANAARKIDQRKIITADILSLVVQNAANRTTLEQFSTSLRLLFNGLDAYCLHIYGSGFNYVGCQANEDAAFPNSSATDLGYEGLPALMESLKALADADGKPLIIGEFGVPTNEESDVLHDKKNRFIRSVASYSSYSMLWNVQDATLANTIPNQVAWYIDPATARAATFKSLVESVNSARPAPVKWGGGLKGLRQMIQPRYAFKGTRVADATIKFTSSAAHASSSGYSLMLWLRLDAPLNSNEFIVGLNGANTSGVALLANAGSNMQSFFYETRAAGGSQGNTPFMTPDVSIGEWNHFAFTSEGVNGGAAIRMYVNGLYWRTLPCGGAPTSIIAAVNMFIGGGNSNTGIPASYQDICLAGSISPQDVSDHMRGMVIPQALLHVRARPNKTALDLSRSQTPITFGAGISIVQV